MTGENNNTVLGSLLPCDCSCDPSSSTEIGTEDASSSSSGSSLSDGEGEGFDWLDGDNLAFYLGLLGVFGSIVAYFVQRNYERYQELQAELSKLEDMDRQQALERVRLQLSVYIGPLHRLCKSQNTLLMQYRLEHNIQFAQLGGNIGYVRHSDCAKGNNRYDPWVQFLPNAGYLDDFIADPMSLPARRYRNTVRYRWKPIYTQIRDLILHHSSDLADLPTQEEYLEKYHEDSIMSPYVGSINIHVIFDTYTVFTYEFDEIIAGWEEDDGDYTRMQPATKVAWAVCNYIVDYLYDNAKLKQSTYNQHVSVHQNTRQGEKNTVFELERRRLVAFSNNSDNNDDGSSIKDGDNNDDHRNDDDDQDHRRGRIRKTFRRSSESTTSSTNSNERMTWNHLPESPSLELWQQQTGKE